MNIEEGCSSGLTLCMYGHAWHMVTDLKHDLNCARVSRQASVLSLLLVALAFLRALEKLSGDTVELFVVYHVLQKPQSWNMELWRIMSLLSSLQNGFYSAWSSFCEGGLDNPILYWLWPQSNMPKRPTARC